MTATLQDIVALQAENRFSRIPVYKEDLDDIVGAVFVKDLVPLLEPGRYADATPEKYMRSVLYVPEGMTCSNLLHAFQKARVHLAIVVDEYGGTEGMVTMEDLLEEIVGNIYDEFDPLEDQEIVPLGDNLWRIAGGADLDDVAQALDVQFPEDEDTETLGGLVFAQLSVIPEDGSHPEVDACGLHIKVEELTDRRVEWALVSKLPPTEAKDGD